MSYTELLKECESAFDSISISEEQAVNIELASRDQSSTKVWFQVRSGRTTASRFKAACHTDVSQPSQSLIKLSAILKITGSLRKLPSGDVIMRRQHVRPFS